MAHLLHRTETTLQPFLALGAFAGLRTAEWHRLDWSEIDLDRGCKRSENLATAVGAHSR